MSNGLGPNDERRRAIRKRLEELERDGRLTPAAVVEDARNPESPLHDELFDDPDVLINEALLARARALIRSVRVEVATSTMVISAPRYIRDPDADQREQGYAVTTQILTDRERARRALVHEFDRVLSQLERAAEVATALGLADSIIDLRRQVEALALKFTEEVKTPQP